MDYKDHPIEKLRREKGYDTQEALAIKSGMSVKSYRKFLKTGTLNAENLKALAVALNVSVDYLLGAVTFKNVGNDEITKLTGLSDKSIEVLREIKRRADNPGWDDDCSAEASAFIACLNLILENTEVRVDHEIRPETLWLLDVKSNTGKVVTTGKMEVDDKKYLIDSFLISVMKYLGKRPTVKGFKDGDLLEFEGEDSTHAVAPLLLYRTWLRDMVLQDLDVLARKKEGQDNGKH